MTANQKAKGLLQGRGWVKKYIYIKTKHTSRQKTTQHPIKRDLRQQHSCHALVEVFCVYLHLFGQARVWHVFFMWGVLSWDFRT